MKVANLPLIPLIHTFLASLRGEEPSCSKEGLSPAFFDTATESDFEATIVAIDETVSTPSLHRETLRKKVRRIRHGVDHLLRCPDPLTSKLDRCLAREGAYFVPGIGLRFWSGFLHQIDSKRYPIWSEASEVGLQQLGFWGKSADTKAKRYAKLLLVCDRLYSIDSRLTPSQACRFLALVAQMRGRELFPLENEAIHSPWFRTSIDALPDLIRQLRIRSPLRKRLKEHQSQVQAFRKQFDEALQSEDRTQTNELLLHHGIPSIPQSLFDWTLQLWKSDQPEELLTTFWGCEDATEVGMSFPVRLLHLRDPKQFPIWDEGSRRGLSLLDEGFDPSLPPNISYSLYREATQVIGEGYRVHSLEMMDLLHLVSQRESNLRYEKIEEQSQFHGFCADTFTFLKDLSENNQTTWMNQQRERYQFVIREPLLELCHRLSERYIEPVLRKGFGWDLETEPRTGKAISSIVKNDYGQTVPYQPWMWLTFYRRDQNKQQDVQFFVRIDSSGLQYGFHLGKKARESGSRFRKNMQEHGELIYRNLVSNQALKECQFFNDQGQTFPIKNATDLRTWATEKSLFSGRRLTPDLPLLRQDDLVGEIVLTFDRLLPLFVCSLEDDARTYLQKRVGSLEGEIAFDSSTFQSQTYLPKSWLDRALHLLELKKQLILQGVPGTGKTHIAKNLARFLTGDKSENIRLVQFHPAFSYEEFVEGIKARTVEINGRNEITYPIEEGVLCDFASQATRQPSKPFVLLIDEINRGNLPRIFGELLYLLEYRDQAVSLPYSRRSFRLPQNLYLIGTMNSADRSVAAIDQALRRRFSFLEMSPDSGVLASWFEKHPLKEGEGFGQQVVTLFETLNEQLQQDLGPNYQIGHSYFMVPNLDESRLRMVWQHHIQPLLQEYFTGQQQRLSAYDLDLLLKGKDNRKRKKIEY